MRCWQWVCLREERTNTHRQIGGKFCLVLKVYPPKCKVPLKSPFPYIISNSVPSSVDLFWENALSGKHHICIWERLGRKRMRGSGSVKICNLIWSSGEDFWVHSVGQAKADYEFWSNARQVQKTKGAFYFAQSKSMIVKIYTECIKNDKAGCLCLVLRKRFTRFLKLCCRFLSSFSWFLQYSTDKIKKWFTHFT